MNKESFDANLASLQAQLDAADRASQEANDAARAARAAYIAAKRELRGHVSYGKHMGWVERTKRASKPVLADAAE